ncbi:MAG: 5-methylcytosine-specific restriction endonuclease system specificity protein McrC [Tissierellia bacterium]|nr:5-methylcytosine-specific restriction endonuclease system specificity protein McrC [Tissierellia bacterium]
MIPIKNIYYMLCYAWDNILNQGQETLLDVEALENIYNLLSSILIKEANKIIKSGIYKGYVECTESISVVRGRINLNDTLKEQSLIRNKIVCDFHEFSENIILNQILKTTMETLLTCKEVDRKYRDQMRMLLRNFSGVHSVDINNVSWSRINYNRNNKKYRLIINVCELINTGLILKEEKGKYRFVTFIKDKAMAKLYEKFIFNFYKYELKDIKTTSSIIKWRLDEPPSDNFLPNMETDIELEGKDKKLIIDTKYYSNALTKSNFSETKKLISSNLYQIFAYVKNAEYDGEINGMLLYPTVNYDLNQAYKMSGNNIYVKTLNLGEEFDKVRNKLLSIADIVRCG